LLFYIGGTLIVGLLVPSNNPLLQLNSGTAQSPFVIAIETAGIKFLPSVSRTFISLCTSKFSLLFKLDCQCLFVDLGMVRRI
jgi:amino acid permease